jgi:DNA-binding PucR family transcriptional regulator
MSAEVCTIIRSRSGLLGDVAYGLVPLAGDPDKSEQRAKRIAGDFLVRTGSRAPAVIGIGPAVSDASRLNESRGRADRALRVLRAKGEAGAVGTAAEKQVDALMLELQDLTLARNDPIAKPLARIQQYDIQRKGRLVETLECWLNSFGDINAAASAAGVHPNTFRYRLKKLEEVADIDLESSDDRFAMMLQLRLMHPPGG